ncbi:MAG: hypothetical protein EXR60_04605 [Dehalococcoidia bacterium]|nr:hypothetical protein [Dehalococcoidia bacterium]
MFFVSEEFLRRYQQDKDTIHSTLGEVVAPGQALFDTEKAPEKAARYREVKGQQKDQEVPPSG